jgi:hypothetical protein
MHLQDILETFSFGRYYQNSWSYTLKLYRPIEVDGLIFQLSFFGRCLNLCPLGHEVAEHLSLDCCHWLVDDVIHRRLNGSFGNLTSCLPIIQYLAQSRRCVNLDPVRLKVMG